MKNIVKYITESTVKEWVAVQVTTAADSYHKKDTTSQRVVSYDTYKEMKNSGHTKGYMQVKYIEMLSPICKTKEAAMEYIDVPTKQVKKGKIDKGDADYIVWCISSGQMNPSGKTKWDWNFWEEWKDNEIYLDEWGRSFLMGAPGSLKVGDKVFCVDNDSQKKLPGAPSKIKAVCKCNIEDFRKTYRETFPDYCKNPSYQFGKKSDGLPWQRRIGQFYSIKGVAEEV